MNFLKLFGVKYVLFKGVRLENRVYLHIKRVSEIGDERYNGIARILFTKKMLRKYKRQIGRYLEGGVFNTFSFLFFNIYRRNKD